MPSAIVHLSSMAHLKLDGELVSRADFIVGDSGVNGMIATYPYTQPPVTRVFFANTGDTFTRLYTDGNGHEAIKATEAHHASTIIIEAMAAVAIQKTLVQQF